MFAVLGPLLSLLGIEVESITDSVKRHAVVWGVVGVLALVFVVFLLVAANAALSQVVGPIVAPLIIAVAAAVIALIVYLVASLQDAAAARRDAERRKNAENTALVTTAIISALPMVLKSPLMREIGIPAGAAIASALLLRRTGTRPPRQEP